MNDVPLTEVLPEWAIQELREYLSRQRAGQFTLHTDDRGEVVKAQANTFRSKPSMKG